MVNYKCDYCGTYFDKPVTVPCWEYIVDFPHGYTEEACPICGSVSFSNADNCHQCGDPMLAGNRLCDTCRAGLKKRVLAFAGELSPAETEQLDEWMDGNSIQDANNWK